jgi:hypothetical protein
MHVYKDSMWLGILKNFAKFFASKQDLGKDENGTEISQIEPHRFLHLIRLNPYFQTNSNSVRNSEHKIRNRIENGLDIFRSFFYFSTFNSKYLEFKIQFKPNLVTHQYCVGNQAKANEHRCTWAALDRQLNSVAPPWVAEVALIPSHGAASGFTRRCIWHLLVLASHWDEHATGLTRRERARWAKPGSYPF